MNPNIQWQGFKHPTKIKHQLLCLWMTGLSGAGKSTLANTLEEKLNAPYEKKSFIAMNEMLKKG